MASVIAEVGGAAPEMLRFLWSLPQKRNFTGKSPPLFMEHRRSLRGDCAACQGLCCVGLAFDRSEWFGFDKPCDVPCPHLEPTNRCAIHAQLPAAGQAGCASYDCYGAGQRVSQALFAGASWRDDPRRARAMFSAFRRLKEVHELRWLLHEAGGLPLQPAHEAERARLLGLLEPEPELSAQALDALDLETLGVEAHRLLRSLRGYVAGEPPRRRLPLRP